MEFSLEFSYDVEQYFKEYLQRNNQLVTSQKEQYKSQPSHDYLVNQELQIIQLAILQEPLIFYLYPVKKYQRCDPYDNQTGEVEYEDEGLLQGDFETINEFIGRKEM